MAPGRHEYFHDVQARPLETLLDKYPGTIKIPACLAHFSQIGKDVLLAVLTGYGYMQVVGFFLDEYFV